MKAFVLLCAYIRRCGWRGKRERARMRANSVLAVCWSCLLYISLLLFLLDCIHKDARFENWGSFDIFHYLCTYSSSYISYFVYHFLFFIRSVFETFSFILPFVAIDFLLILFSFCILCFHSYPFFFLCLSFILSYRFHSRFTFSFSILL